MKSFPVETTGLPCLYITIFIYVEALKNYVVFMNKEAYRRWEGDFGEL